MEIIIDPEIQNLIPPLKPDEFENLRTSILKEGCREPIIVWSEKNILVDGHNRYKICTENDLSFSTFRKSFDDKEEAIVWIIDNQMGRRNLEPIDKIPLTEKRRAILERQARERQATSTGGTSPQLKENFPEADTGQTRDKLGAMIGVSGKTYNRLKNVVENGTQEVVEAVRSKKIGAETGDKISRLPPEEQHDGLLSATKAKKKSKPTPEKLSRKEKQEHDKIYSAESRQFVDSAKLQLERIRDNDPYGIIALKDLIKWSKNKIKNIERGILK